MHAFDRLPARSAALRAARHAAGAAVRLGTSAAFLLAALALPAQAIVHDRLPGDDAGGSSSLPVPAAGERVAAAPAETGVPGMTGVTAGARVVDRSE